jgi:hypothetical protein
MRLNRAMSPPAAGLSTSRSLARGAPRARAHAHTLPSLSSSTNTSSGGPTIEAFPRLSFFGIDAAGATGAARAAEQEKPKRKSFRFPCFRTSAVFGRGPQTPARNAPEVSEEETVPAGEEAGQGRFSVDYGGAAAVLSFSLVRGGEAHLDLAPPHGRGALQLQPLRHRSSPQVEVIALIHELAQSDQAERAQAASAALPQPAASLQEGAGDGVLRVRSPQEVIAEYPQDFCPDLRREILHYEKVHYYSSSKGSDAAKPLGKHSEKKGAQVCVCVCVCVCIYICVCVCVFVS